MSDADWIDRANDSLLPNLSALNAPNRGRIPDRYMSAGFLSARP
jgi:hypothetical protein